MTIVRTLLFGLLVFQGFVRLFSQACDKCSSVLHALLCLHMFSFVHHLVFPLSLLSLLVHILVLGVVSQEGKPERVLLKAVQL